MSNKKTTKRTINMLSSAHKIKGQGVGSAYEEQVALVKEHLAKEYEVFENKVMMPDITHYHTIDVRFSLFRPWVKRRGMTVGYVHMIPETVENSLRLPPVFKKWFYRYMVNFYKRMDFLVTVNSYFIGKLEDLGIDRDKVTYIPNYVSGEVFFKCEAKNRSSFREKHQIPQDKFVVLGVGQLQTRKGIFDFVETAKRLPDIHFVWAGGFSFGAITDGYNDIKKYMETPPANVQFLGIVEREVMPEIYNTADVMFLPSFEELFPMTVLESMSCQIPILLRDLDIYEDILMDFYLKADSVESFVDRIQRLAEDPKYYEAAVAASGRGRIFYSKEHVSSLWKAFYDKVYEEKVRLYGEG